MKYVAVILSALCLFGTAAQAEEKAKPPVMQPEAVMDAALAKEPVKSNKMETKNTKSKKDKKKTQGKVKKKAEKPKAADAREPAHSKPPVVNKGPIL